MRLHQRRAYKIGKLPRLALSGKRRSAAPVVYIIATKRYTVTKNFTIKIEGLPLGPSSSFPLLGGNEGAVRKVQPSNISLDQELKNIKAENEKNVKRKSGGAVAVSCRITERVCTTHASVSRSRRLHASQQAHARRSTDATFTPSDSIPLLGPSRLPCVPFRRWTQEPGCQRWRVSGDGSLHIGYEACVAGFGMTRPRWRSHAPLTRPREHPVKSVHRLHCSPVRLLQSLFSHFPAPSAFWRKVLHLFVYFTVPKPKERVKSACSCEQQECHF